MSANTLRSNTFSSTGTALSLPERTSIQIKAINKIKGKGKEYTEQLINDRIELLQDGRLITRKRLEDFTGLSESTIKRYWKPFKSSVDEYNKEILWRGFRRTILLRSR